MPPAFCSACGAPAQGGNFCSACGEPLAAGTCRACGTTLSAGARFCHRCGEPVGGRVSRRRERTAWSVAGATCVALVALIIWWVVRDAPPPEVPDMANPGSAAAGAVPSGAVSGPAPDISTMSRREQFDRLYSRVSAAAAAGDSAQVVMFLPMALGAYARLDTIDAPARFQAAILYLGAGQDAAARSLADSIAAGSIGILYADAIRATVDEIQGDSAATRRDYRGFLDRYDAELRNHATVYARHLNELSDFRIRAEAALAPGS